MKLNKFVLFSITFALTAMSCITTGNKIFNLDKVVTLDSGKISGEFLDGSSVISYKGIPYAAPPVGELRWKAPQPVASWDGVLDTTEFGHSAWQQPQNPYRMWSKEFIVSNKDFNEDCLTLNVWADSALVNSKKPVVVFIHGGGFNSGGSSCDVYKGDEIVKKGVVYVSINYRLGIFGFMGHPELTAESDNGLTGNYGVLDSIEALKWVQRNIEQFGGDADNVTIMGQSAGSRMVHALAVTPLAKGLFHKAIAESANPFNTLGRRGLSTVEEQEALGETMMDYIGKKSIAELRAMSGEELASFANGYAEPGNPPGFPTKLTVDGYVFPDKDIDAYKKGTQTDVPLLTGSVDGDVSIIGPRVTLTVESYQELIRKDYGDLADEFLSLYPATTDEEANFVYKNDVVRDQMNVRLYELAKARSIHGESDTYMFYFTKDIPAAGEVPPSGAFHTGDVPYFLNFFYQDETRPWTEADYKLGDTMSNYVVNFAKTGNPNSDGLFNWPKFDQEDPKFLELGDNIKFYDGLDQEKFDFWIKALDIELGL